MLVKTYCAAVNGLDISIVTVETDIAPGQSHTLSGLGDEAVRESQSRIRTAIVHSGYKFPNKAITVNLSPANIRKEGSAYDLPLSVGLLAANEVLPPDKLAKYLILGELGLDGSLKPIKGALPIAILAEKQGFEGIILPKANAQEAAVVGGLRIYGMENLTDVILFLSDIKQFQPATFDTQKVFATITQRKPRNNTDTLHSRKTQHRQTAHPAKTIQSTTPYHITSRTRRRRPNPPTR